MSSAARRGLFIFLVGLVVLIAAMGFEIWRQAGEEEGPVTAAVSIGGSFTLVDQNGTVRHDTDFRGKLMLVYFGYTYCPDVCPTELQKIGTALDQLGDKQNEVQPVFITIDPERDTVAQMKDYAANFHPRLVALTGTAEQVAAAARVYRVYYQKVKQSGDDDYLMDHSSFVYLMGRDGRYIAHFAPDATPQAMAAAIKARL